MRDCSKVVGAVHLLLWCAECRETRAAPEGLVEALTRHR